jgi:hypothetical protein
LHQAIKIYRKDFEMQAVGAWWNKPALD